MLFLIHIFDNLRGSLNFLLQFMDRSVLTFVKRGVIFCLNYFNSRGLCSIEICLTNEYLKIDLKLIARFIINFLTISSREKL